MFFEGTVAGPIPFAAVPKYQPETKNGLWVELGAPWAFYRQFWKVHDLTGVQNLFKPQVQVGVSSQVHIPVLIHNETGAPANIEVNAAVPAGWGTAQGAGIYPVRAHENGRAEVSPARPARRKKRNRYV